MQTLTARAPYVHQPHQPAAATIEAKRQPRAKRRAIARRQARRMKFTSCVK